MIYEKARANYMRKAIPFLVMLIMLLSAVLTNAEEIPMITSSNGKIY